MVPPIEPLPMVPPVELTEPDAEPGLMVPLVLLLAEPFGDCWAPEPLVLMPESTLLLGVATMPLSDALPLGVIVEPLVDVPAAPAVPAVPVWAKAKPEAARLMHKLLATNKRDISFS
jgi:hypothetical protein